MLGRPTRRPKLCVFGYHPSGATGTVFPFGIMVGAERSLDWRPTHRGHNARRAAAHFRRDMAFTNQVRDTRLEHQQRAHSTAVTPVPASSRGL